VAKALQNGYVFPNEHFARSPGDYYVLIEGQEFDPTALSRDEALERIWAQKFVAALQPTAAKRKIEVHDLAKILKYRKGGIPAEQARLVFENG
jgi:hypothetical protein